MPIDPKVAAWIVRRRQQGRGEGEGAAYRPWLTIRDFSSRGVSHRPKGRNGREYHLMSTLEYHCFLLLQWSDLVADVREQFPLHDLEETLAIAAELGAAHPKQSRRVGGVIVRREEPMTTDFLVTLADTPHAPPQIAVSVKPLSDITDAPAAQIDRLLEKAEIERLYWQRRGVEFRLVTEREMPPAVVANLDRVLPCRTLEAADYGLTEAAVPGYLAYLFDQLAASTDVPFRRVCSAVDAQLQLGAGTCLTLVWHAVASKQWSVALHEPLDPDRPLRGLRATGAVRGAPAPRPNASVALLGARAAADRCAAESNNQGEQAA